jgi:hypothetical protein
VARTCKNKWFYGHTDRKVAEDILKHCDPGTYLVRLNTELYGVFTLSKVNREKKIAHQRIAYSAREGFTIGKTLPIHCPPGCSLRSFLKSLAGDLNLVKACEEKWPYQHIFGKVKTAGVFGYSDEIFESQERKNT